MGSDIPKPSIKLTRNWNSNMIQNGHEHLQSRSYKRKKRRAVLVNLQDWIRRSNRRQRNDQSVARPVQAASGEGDNRQIPHLFPWWLLVQARVPSPPLLPPQTVLEPFYSLLGVLVFSCSRAYMLSISEENLCCPITFFCKKIILIQLV